MLAARAVGAARLVIAVEANKPEAIVALREAATRAGMRPLVTDGKIKILRGETTPEEVARFAQAEELLGANVDI